MVLSADGGVLKPVKKAKQLHNRTYMQQGFVTGNEDEAILLREAYCGIHDTF